MLLKCVDPRWRRLSGALLILTGFVLSGCAPRTNETGGPPLPTVRVAMFKIPLNGERAGEDVLKEADPIERFIQQTESVSYSPSW